jgi:hypothetical protein
MVSRAPGPDSLRLHNASTNSVDSGAMERNPEESMKTSKVLRISSLTEKARLLADF